MEEEVKPENIRDFILNTINEQTDKKSDQIDLVLDNIKDGENGKDGKDGKSIKGDKGDSIKGDKGDDGKTPAKTFLLSLIKPLIPKPKKGDKGDNIKGDKGELGEKGKDGSPDKPKDIVKKLNTLENVLDVKVLKGLSPILKTIQDSIRAINKGGGSVGGGGGMGTPIHQSFPCDGATTSFTLSNNVAAQGNAIWSYYNGQFLVLGTHYTISGKVLTTTFIAEDDTQLDVTYIRSG